VDAVTKMERRHLNPAFLCFIFVSFLFKSRLLYVVCIDVKHFEDIFVIVLSCLWLFKTLHIMGNGEGYIIREMHLEGKGGGGSGRREMRGLGRRGEEHIRGRKGEK
jgi:hypothetical protein